MSAVCDCIALLALSQWGWTGCFLDGAVGHPALFSPDAVCVLAVVGGPLRIGLGISIFGRCDFLAFDRFNFSQ